MKEIQQRSGGYVTSDYHSAKRELEKKAKKGFCIICGKPVGKRRRKYCTDECFTNWFKQFKPPFLWNELRRRARRRDKYRCVKCKRTEKKLEKLYKGSMYEWSPKLIVDHIVPIALGGDEFDMNNLQTLCIDCNRIKTREDAKKIAELRREIKGNEKRESELELKIKMGKKWEEWRANRAPLVTQSA